MVAAGVRPVHVSRPVTGFHRFGSLALRVAPALVPAVIVFLVYFPAIKLGMVWDDHVTFQSVPYYSDPAFVFDAIRNPLVYFPNYFRPLVVISFLIQTFIFGIDPLVFHITSVFLHLLNTILLAIIALRLAPSLAPKFDPRFFAGIAGLMYGLHPALIEPVVFLSSRFDLLLTFFLLLALLADVSIRRPIVRAIAVGLAFLLATLCKEMALGLPLALPLWHLAREPRPILPFRAYLRSLRERGELYVYVAVFLGGLLYLGIRYKAIGYILQPVDPENTMRLHGITPIVHVQLVGYTILQYLKLVFLPFGNLAPAHPLPLPFVTTVSHWLIVAFELLLVAVTLWLMHRRVRGAYLFAAALLSLFPISNVLILPRPTGGFFAESYLVFPMVLFVLASSTILIDLYRCMIQAVGNSGTTVRSGAVMILFIWFLASLVTVRHTIPLWNSDLVLWSWGAREEPNSTLAAANLATAYVSNHQPARAAAEAVRLLKIPGATRLSKSTGWWILANLAFEAGRTKTAIMLITRAADNSPNLSNVHMIAARYLNADGQYRKAAEQARASLKQLPYQSAAHIELGVALLGMGQYKEAVSELRSGGRAETDPVNKKLAKQNLRIAEEALERQSRGLKTRVQPVFRLKPQQVSGSHTAK